MKDEQRNLLPFLRVGELAVLNLNPHNELGPRHKTTIRGWCAGSHIILDRPIVGDRHVHLQKGEICVVRFLAQGKACGFDSIVLDYDLRQEKPTCTVLWPSDFELLSFRRHERVTLLLPCRVTVGSEVLEGEIQDISVSGCKLGLRRRVEMNSTITISFDLPGGLAMENLRVVVRNQLESAEGVVLGGEIDQNQEHLQSDIAFFVASSLERNRPSGRGSQRVFIVDADHASSATLAGLFNDKGWQAFVATSSVEGLLRLRMLPPAALLINEAQEDMVGVGVLQLLRSSRGFEHLSIFVYNGKNAELREKAAEAGLSAYFDAGAPLYSICTSVIATVADGAA